MLSVWGNTFTLNETVYNVHRNQNITKYHCVWKSLRTINIKRWKIQTRLTFLACYKFTLHGIAYFESHLKNLILKEKSVSYNWGISKGFPTESYFFQCYSKVLTNFVYMLVYICVCINAYMYVYVIVLYTLELFLSSRPHLSCSLK